jgi:hypothetical protein
MRHEQYLERLEELLVTSRLARLIVVPASAFFLGLLFLFPLSALTGGPAFLTQLFSPADFRDVGKVRVFADNFIEAGGSFTATGNVAIGPASGDNRWFTISQAAVSISGTQRITLTGQLAMAGATQLLSGTFAVNTANGSLTIPTDALNLYQKLGDSSIAITPTYTINMLTPEVDARAQATIVLPEGVIRPDLRFRIGFGGQVTGTAAIPINLQLAGGALTATVNITQSGLHAPSVLYTIAGYTLTLSDFLINGEGEAKLRFGAAADFPLPNIDLGDGVLVLTQLRGTLGIETDQLANPTGYRIGLRGKLKIDKLPENTTLTVDTVDLKFSGGRLSGGVSDLALSYSGGNTMRFRGLRFGRAGLAVASADPAAGLADPAAALAFRDVLFAEGAEFDLPKELRPADEITPTVRLQNVTIQSTAPYITIGGAGIRFTIGKTYYLGGDAAASPLKLSNISGVIDFDFANSRWSTALTATLGLKLGDGVETAVTGNLRTDSTGKFQTRIVGVALDVAGMRMAVNQLDFQADRFTAASASLTLPEGYGNVTINNIRIDRDGLSVGGGVFTVPNIALDPVRLTENQGAFKITNNRYSVEITSTIRVEGGATPLPGSGGATGVLVRGRMKIENGVLTGTLDQFGFVLSGLEFRLTNPTFLRDRVRASQASMIIPTGGSGGSGLTVSANGIEIGGPAGFKFRQPTIQIPDFTLAGVGIRAPRLTIDEVPRSNPKRYRVTGSAELQFVQFAVAGNFTFIQRAGGGFDLNPVHLDFRATPGIPLGQSGFELTRITADFNLTRNSVTIQMSTRIESQVKVVIPIIAMDGTITLQVVPRFDFRARAGVQMMAITVSTADLHITPSAARLTGTLEYQVARQIVDLSFGLDRNREFTMFGSMRSELGLRKGSLVNWCVPFVGCATVPPFDFTVAAVQYDAGKYRDRRDGQGNRVVWGGRAQFTVFATRAYAFLRLAPTPVNIAVGTDLDDYRAVAPAQLAAGIARPQAEPQIAPDAPYFIPADGQHGFAITRTAELLVFAEVVTATNLGLPLQPLVATAPWGAQFTLDPFYTSDDGVSRLFSLIVADPPAAVGTWQISSTPGNAVKMWGQRPSVKITQFAAVAAGGQDLSPALASSAAEPVIQAGAAITVSAEISKPLPGVSISLFAEDAAGMRYEILEQTDEANTTVAVTTVWPALVPNGIYTLTLVADDPDHSFAVTSTVPFRVEDLTPPPAPTGLMAAAQLDGSALLTWDASSAADVMGYEIGVEGGEAVRLDGVRQRYTVSGLAPGSSATFNVRAYDASDNLGPAATASVDLPDFRLESVTPATESAAQAVRAVAAAFNGPIAWANLALVDRANQPVLGASRPLTVEVELGVVETLGVELGFAQPLAAGVYTATVTADRGGYNMATWQWSFTVQPARWALFLPSVQR